MKKKKSVVRIHAHSCFKNFATYRYSYFSMAPHIVPFGKMESWYRAYNKFANLVRDENHQFK